MDQDKALLEEVSCENKIPKECLEEKKQELGILNTVHGKILEGEKMVNLANCEPFVNFFRQLFPF